MKKRQFSARGKTAHELWTAKQSDHGCLFMAVTRTQGANVSLKPWAYDRNPRYLCP